MPNEQAVRRKRSAAEFASERALCYALDDLCEIPNLFTLRLFNSDVSAILSNAASTLLPIISR